MPDLEIREFDIRETSSDERTVTGVAVPWDEVAAVSGYSERFQRGAVQESDDALLFWRHQEPIGRVIQANDTDQGWEITAKISQTPRGDEAMTLLRDGVISKFSIGFLPVKSHDDKGVVVRTNVRVREVSLVPHPAYQNAAVATVRSADSEEEVPMNDTTNAEVNDLREAVSDLEREVRSFASRDSGPQADQFRNGGEWLKALASGDTAAQELVRAYSGATTADANVRPAWVQKELRLVEESRPLIGLFDTAPLPATGNSVSYPRVSATTGSVSAQAYEGADLPYMEVVLGDASVPVVTYGGYSSMSRQVIERSDQPYLQKVLRYQALQYARATEKAVRTVLTTGTGYNTATLAADTAAGWIDLVIDSLGLIQDNGMGATGEFMLVSRNVFKRISHIVDGSGRPLFVVNGDGVNTVGSVNVLRSSANVAGLPVLVGSALADNSVFVASSEAIQVFESPGAPFRLQDENVINLTKDFSLYGYMASGIANAGAVVKVDADLV